MISSLSHPHICTLHDIGRHDGIDYLVMEYIEGATLSQKVARGPLRFDDVLRFGIQIADALSTAHRAGIINRDLKPGRPEAGASRTILVRIQCGRAVDSLLRERKKIWQWPSAVKEV